MLAKDTISRHMDSVLVGVAGLLPGVGGWVSHWTEWF